MNKRVERFQYVVSNPPYQDTKNRPIFQHFQDLATAFADQTSMIYMASRWWYGTSGLQDFRDTLLSNPRFEGLTYFNEIESSKLIFDGTGIAGGVNIVTLRAPQDTDLSVDHTTQFTLTEYATGESVTLPHGDLRLLPQRASLVHIAQKIQHGMDQHNLTTLLARDEHTVNEVGLTGKQLNALEPLTATVESVVPDGRMKVYANISGSKGGTSDYYTIQQPPGYELNTRHKVCIGQSIVENENRALRLLQFAPDTTFGRSTISLAFFDTQEEADNFATYVSSRFFEFALRLSLSGRMKTFGAFAPDFADYTSTNPVLDWSQPLDPQLYALFELNDEEVVMIEQTQTFKKEPEPA